MTTRYATHSIRKILLVIALLLPLLLLGQESQKRKPLDAGARAPAIHYDVSYPQGYTIPPKKAILLDFWATWCGPCIAGLVELNPLVPKFKDKVEFLAITDSTSRGVEQFIQGKNFNYTFLINKDESVFESFGVSGIPHAFLIDENNVIQWSGSSRWLSADMLEEFLATGSIKPRQLPFSFDKNRYKDVPKSTDIYILSVLDPSKLDKHKTMSISKIAQSDPRAGGGIFSSAPEWEGSLTAVNFNLKRLAERTAGYFPYLTLTVEDDNIQGYDFYAVPFDDFDTMNKNLEEVYGIKFVKKK